jgi:hypothetical protein
LPLENGAAERRETKFGARQKLKIPSHARSLNLVQKINIINRSIINQMKCVAMLKQFEQ